MKRVFVGVFLFLLLVSSSLIYAASSEIGVDFNVGSPEKNVVSSVPVENVLGDYLGYFILVFIAVAFVYFISKRKKVVTKKKVSRPKNSSSKKIKRKK